MSSKEEKSNYSRPNSLKTDFSALFPSTGAEKNEPVHYKQVEIPQDLVKNGKNKGIFRKKSTFDFANLTFSNETRFWQALQWEFTLMNLMRSRN